MSEMRTSRQIARDIRAARKEIHRAVKARDIDLALSWDKRKTSLIIEMSVLHKTSHQFRMPAISK